MWFAGHPNGQSVTAASKRRSLHNSLTTQFGLDGTAVIELKAANPLAASCG